MHHFRWTIFHSLLILLIFVGVKCADPSGSGLNAASCSPINGFNQEFEIDTSGYEGPVSLPVTIAKIDGIDAPTMNFVAIDRSLTRAAATIGTISFYTIDRGPSCSSVGVFINNEQVDTLSAITSDCLYTFTVTEDDVDIPIAFAVISPGGGSVSDPVIAVVTDAADLIAELGSEYFEQQYLMQVFTTNMASSTGNATADVINIPNASMTLASRSRADDEETYIIFAAEDSDGSVYLWTVSDDGDAEILSTDPLDATPLSISNTYEGTPYVLNENGLFQISSSGTLSDIDLPDFLTISGDDYNRQSFIALNPGEPNYVVYVGNSDTGSLRPMFTNLGTGDTCIFYDEGSRNDFSALEISIFSQNEVVLVGKMYGEDTYQVITLGLSDAISNMSSVNGNIVCNATFHTAAESTGFMGRPVKNITQFQDIYLIAESSGLRQLARISNNDELVVLTDLPVDVISASVPGDGGSGIILELNTTRRTGAFYDIETGETSVFALGSKLSPLLSEPNLLTFIERVNGYPQVCVKDISAFLDAPSELTIFPDSATVQTYHTQDFVVSGGTPPYTFAAETVTASGDVDIATGQLTTNSSSGTLNVIATDAVGNTVTAEVIVSPDPVP